MGADLVKERVRGLEKWRGRECLRGRERKETALGGMREALVEVVVVAVAAKAAEERKREKVRVEAIIGFERRKQ